MLHLLILPATVTIHMLNTYWFMLMVICCSYDSGFYFLTRLLLLPLTNLYVTDRH